MSKIISVHEYVLQPDVSETEFEKAIKDARERGLLQLPGLTEFHFLRGIRGARQRQYGFMKAGKCGKNYGDHRSNPETNRSIRKHGKSGRIRFWRLS